MSRTDSAGIEVVANRTAAWRAGEGWRVPDRHVLEIGGPAGDGTSQLYRVRNAVRLSDGRIVVAERSTNRILYFDRRGGALLEVGGEGDGPGEYRALTEVRRLRGDSLLAFDLLRSSVTVLDQRGETVDAVPLRGTPGERLLIGSAFRLSDGRFIGAGTWSTGQVDDAAPPGLYRPATATMLFAADGSLQDTVAVYPSADMAVTPVRGQRTTSLTLFTRITRIGFRGEALYVGTGESLEIRVHDVSGRLVRLLRGPASDLTITPEDIEAQQRARRGDSSDPDVNAYFDALFEGLPLPDRKPAFEEMFVDRSGAVWLGPFKGVLETNDPWTVFGPDGRLLGSVAMPPSIDVVDIDGEYVLAVWRDALDVERVRLYPIEKPEGSPRSRPRG